jgi:hypothetical protein
MNRIFSPSPTVASTRVPLYMQGWPPHGMLAGLGQDPTMYDPGSTLVDPTVSMDPTMYDPGTTLISPTEINPLPNVFLPSIGPVTPIPTSMYDPAGNLVAPAALPPQTQAMANMYSQAVAAGTMTPAQASAAVAQLLTAGTAVAKAATGTATSVAPRVALPATAPSSFTAALTSLFGPQPAGGIAPGYLLAAGLVLVLALGRK